MRISDRVARTAFSARYKRAAFRLLAHCAIPLVLVATIRAQTNSNSYEDTVLAVQQRITSGDLDGAHTLLSAAMQRFPSDGGLENLLGVIEVEQGHVDSAREAFSNAIQHNPRLVSAYLNLGRLLLQSADHNQPTQDEALNLYERVERIEPGNAEAHYEAAVLLLNKQRFAASLQEAMKLPAKVRERANVKSVVCADQVALGEKVAAERSATALAMDPAFTEQDASIVLPVLRTAHRADLVEKLFSAAGKRQPLSAAGARILGLAQEAEGRLDLAASTLEQAFAMDSSTVAPLIDLTRVALARDDAQGALGYLAHARTLAPNDASLAFEFGLVCLRLNLLGEALKAVGQAVQLAPEQPEYNLEFGALTTLLEDPARGLPYLQKYHLLRPSDAEGDLALGAAYFAHHDYQHAVPWLRRAVLNPSTVGAAHYYLGSILSDQGQHVEALAELSDAARLRPNQPDVHAELGRMYLEMGKLPEAQAQLERALTLDPDSYEANYALLRLYGRTGDPRRAEQVKRFAELRDHKDQQYREAMRVIEARPISEPEQLP